MEDVFNNITDFLNKFLEFIQNFAQAIIKTIKIITDSAEGKESVEE